MGPWAHGPMEPMGPLGPWAHGPLPFALPKNDPRRGENPGQNVHFIYISFILQIFPSVGYIFILFYIILYYIILYYILLCYII